MYQIDSVQGKGKLSRQCRCLEEDTELIQRAVFVLCFVPRDREGGKLKDAKFIYKFNPPEMI